jgi:hypothetical protein
VCTVGCSKSGFEWILSAKMREAVFGEWARSRRVWVAERVGVDVGVPLMEPGAMLAGLLLGRSVTKCRSVRSSKRQYSARDFRSILWSYRPALNVLPLPSESVHLRISS